MDNPKGTGIISTKLPVRLYWTKKATNREPNRLHAFDSSDGNADKATTVTQNERMAEKKSQNLKKRGICNVLNEERHMQEKFIHLL